MRCPDCGGKKYRRNERTDYDRYNPIGDWLYHSTSLDNLFKILSDMRLKPGGWPGQKFISFSETPTANLQWVDNDQGIALLFRKSDLLDKVIQVDYSRRWLVEHPLHAAYIGQHPLREYSLGRNIDNILEKSLSDEREWISSKQGRSIKLDSLVAILYREGWFGREKVRRIKRAAKGIVPAKYIATYKEGISKLSGSVYVGEVGETLRLEVICESSGRRASSQDYNRTIMTDEQGNQYIADFNLKPSWIKQAEKLGVPVRVTGRVKSHARGLGGQPATFLNHVSMKKDEKERVITLENEMWEKRRQLDAQSQALREYDIEREEEQRPFRDRLAGKPIILSRDEQDEQDRKSAIIGARLQRLIDSFDSLGPSGG